MATYVHRVRAEAWGDSPELVAEKFRGFVRALEQALGRSCSVASQVIELDLSGGLVSEGEYRDTWKGRITINPDVGPDLNSQ